LGQVKFGERCLFFFCWQCFFFLIFPKRQSALIALAISTLSSILVLLSFHYTDHALGQPITKAILAPARLRRLNSYIGGANKELIIMTLKLYNVLSNFAGGREKKSIMEGFAWELKVRNTSSYSLRFDFFFSFAFG